jgi:hypothetical protein
MLERQKLPPSVTGKDIWKRRFKEINAFERHVAWNGTRIVKFHLRISKEEQRKRFLARLEEPVKRWKFSMGDVTDRQRWDEYMMAYEDMIRSTSTEEAPGAGRSQTRCASRGLRRDLRGLGKAQARLPEDRRQGTRGTQGGRARIEGGKARSVREGQAQEVTRIPSMRVLPSGGCGFARATNRSKVAASYRKTPPPHENGPAQVRRVLRCCCVDRDGRGFSRRF